MKNKLTKKEFKEPLMQTWGRILKAVEFNNGERLKLLVEKFDNDLKRAKIEENYFQEEKATKCPKCHKAYLGETTNAYEDQVFQRVVSCDSCGFVHNFDAPENWKENYHEI